MCLLLEVTPCLLGVEGRDEVDVGEAFMGVSGDCEGSNGKEEFHFKVRIISLKVYFDNMGF